MKLLITAFEPFGGETVNPAQQAVELLPHTIEGAQIHKLLLPVAFKRCFAPLQQAMDAVKPDAVLCIGQAGGRFQITPERVAINCMDAKIADNDGFEPKDQPIVEGGPAAYFSTLPIREIEQALLENGLPAGISNTAGLYVCNTLMYCVLHACATSAPQVRAGFIHVPYMTQQVLQRTSTPSMTLQQIVQGLSVAAGAVVKGLGQ